MARIDVRAIGEVDGWPSHRFVGKVRLMTVGCIRRVNFGRNDTKMILKNPEFRRMLLRSRREPGVEMTLDEFRRFVGSNARALDANP